MIKVLLAVILALGLYSSVEAKCVSGTSYVLKGYLESDAAVPATSKTLTDVIFDVFYDDGTTSLNNTATAEMGQGWYRWSYTSNGKNGVWITRDGAGTNKNFPGGVLEVICDGQDPTAMVQAIWNELKSGHTTAGTFGYYLDAQVSAAGGDPWATAVPGAYGVGTAGNILGTNLNATISSRMASGNVTVGGYAAGQTPADSILTTPANKLGTSLTGQVTVGTNADKTGYTVSTVQDKTGYSLSATGVDAIWDEVQAGHITSGTFGYNLDSPVSLAGGTGGTADWTSTEKGQIRYRLGLDGTVATPTATPTLGTLTANVADKTGFSLTANQSAVTIGTVGTVTNAVTAGTVTDKTGYSLSTAGVDAILNDTIDGTNTVRQALCAAASVLFGKASGGGTTSITFRDLGDTLNRVSETVDASGNRTAVTLNLTGCQ